MFVCCQLCVFEKGLCRSLYYTFPISFLGLFQVCILAHERTPTSSCCSSPSPFSCLDMCLCVCSHMCVCVLYVCVCAQVCLCGHVRACVCVISGVCDQVCMCVVGYVCVVRYLCVGVGSSMCVRVVRYLCVRVLSYACVRVLKYALLKSTSQGGNRVSLSSNYSLHQFPLLLI